MQLRARDVGSQVYGYSAHATGYVGLVIGLGFLSVVEGGVCLFLIAWLAPSGIVRSTLLAVFAGVYLFILVLLLAPLWTRHRLDATHLRLAYGIQFRARIPRSALVAACPLNERTGNLRSFGVSLDAERQQVMATLSDQGRLRLYLDRPYAFRVGFFGSGSADKIVINVDRRDELLVALGLPSIPRVQTPSPFQTPREPLPTASLSSVSPPLSVLAIRTEGLTRKYGDLIAVDGLNLAVRRGEIYGFLGPNGAGKTTTLKMLVGLLEPNAGRAWVDGHDVWRNPLEAKAALGYVADRAILYERLTGREFLEFLAQMRGIPRPRSEERIDYLLHLLELDEYAGKSSGSYSQGMKRKLALAAALIHEPPVLVLDEPFTGLDPRSARRIKDLFGQLAERGISIFLSTHDLATAEAVCHRVGILDRGRLFTEGSAEELRRRVAAPDLEAVFLTLTEEQAK